MPLSDNRKELFGSQTTSFLFYFDTNCYANFSQISNSKYTIVHDCMKSFMGLMKENLENVAFFIV